MKKQNKKSQGSVIVMVLLIVVGIAAVAIVGAFILNMVRENTQLNNVQVDLSIDPVGTFYDTASTLGLGNLNDNSNKVQVIYVKINSQGNNTGVSGLKLVFNTQDNSVSCRVNNIPDLLESRTYRYIAAKPDSVEVYPIVNIGGNEKILGLVAKTNVNAINKSANILGSNIISVDSCSAAGLPDEKVSV